MKCPSCGASVHDDGWSASVTCPYCQAHVTIPREKPAPLPLRSDGRHPLQGERDDLAKRIAQQENDWNARIAALERSTLSQLVLPIFIGLVLAGLVFGIGAMVGSSKGIDPDKGMGPALGCSFYLILFLVPYITYKVRQRNRARQAVALAGQRDQSLEPLRKRLKRLDQRIAGFEDNDPRLRLRELEAERKEISQYMEKVYAHVENVRVGGSSDFIMAPALGCLIGGGMFVVGSLYITRLYTHPERFDDPTVLLWLLGGWVLGTIVVWIVRVVRRGRRLALLTEAREAVIPDCQKQLDRIEEEIARL